MRWRERNLVGRFLADKWRRAAYSTAPGGAGGDSGAGSAGPIVHPLERNASRQASTLEGVVGCSYVDDPQLPEGFDARFSPLT